jgi:endonuclease YncB( thermonuclease family)
LYFIDTTESRSRGKRSDEQAAYFCITRQAAIALGEEAKAFTAGSLAEPFIVDTRWRNTPDGKRYYAIVHTCHGEDLAELLVRAGLARIYGARTSLPDGRDSREYLARLAELEQAARLEGAGGWKR